MNVWLDKLIHKGHDIIFSILTIIFIIFLFLKGEDLYQWMFG